MGHFSNSSLHEPGRVIVQVSALPMTCRTGGMMRYFIQSAISSGQAYSWPL